MFQVLERISPALGGRVAERIWFRLPAAAHEVEPPPGGAAFAVLSQRCTVRGTVWGAGATVYLVHGWGGRGSQLAAFVEPLVRTGHRVVMFDAPSHGRSDPGPSGPGRSTAIELGRALDSVAARFGPARAVVAHSLGSMAALLAVRDGWLGVDRLVLVAPIVDVDGVIDIFSTRLAIGPRTRAHLGDRIARRTGVPLADFAADRLLADETPILVAHDRGDRHAPYAASESLARRRGVGLRPTAGLGHHRILRDSGVVAAAVAHIDGSATAAAPALAS